MIENACGNVEYDESGDGPGIVLVPGSCSTGAAWRPVVAALQGRFRCITTSLLGYGRTADRRTTLDTDMSHEAEAVEAVVRRAGEPVHLVGHSFGGLVALAVALRGRVPLLSLTVIEAPAPELLRQRGERNAYRAFREMTDSYFDAFHAGNRAAIAQMVDFYGGDGTFAAWPERVRRYAQDTTAVNIRDWATAYRFQPAPAGLARLAVPSLVLWGGASHPAVRRANELLAGCLADARIVVLPDAAHFMISTHAEPVADEIARHVRRVDRSLFAERAMKAVEHRCEGVEGD